MLSQFHRFKLKYLLLGQLYVSSCCVFDSRGDTSPCIPNGDCVVDLSEARYAAVKSTWDIRVSEVSFFVPYCFFFFFTHIKANLAAAKNKQTSKHAQFSKKFNIVEFNIRHVLTTSVSVPWEDRSYKWYESWLWRWRRWQPSCGFWSMTSLGGAEKHTRTSPRRWSWSDTPSRAENPGRYPQCSCLSATSTMSRGPAWRHGPGSGCWPHRKRRRTCRRPGTDRTGTGSSGPSDLHRREETDDYSDYKATFQTAVGRILPDCLEYDCTPSNLQLSSQGTSK